MSLQHILLGLCRQPISGYDLKAVFDEAIRYFWSAKPSQIYPTLRRLEEQGLLESRTAPPSKGPARRLYRTTAAGHRTLREWLMDGPAFRNERYVFAAQVFLLDVLADTDASAEFIRKLRTEFEARRRALAAVEAPEDESRFTDPTDMDFDEFHHYLTLRMGLHVVEARIAWCDEALRLLQSRREHKR